MICSRAFMLFRMLFLLRKELPGLKSIRSGQLFFISKNVQKAAGRSVPERYRDPVCGRKGPAAGDHNDRNERSLQSIK